jgi:hypothetical protein
VELFELGEELGQLAEEFGTDGFIMDLLIELQPTNLRERRSG